VVLQQDLDKRCVYQKLILGHSFVSLQLRLRFFPGLEMRILNRSTENIGPLMILYSRKLSR